MEEFRDRYSGERCFIIGNGPSINQQDLSLMKDDFAIGVNGIFLAADVMGFAPSFYVVEDTMVVKDNLEEIRAYHAGHKFFPSIYRTAIGDGPNITYFNMNQGYYLNNSSSFCVPVSQPMPRKGSSADSL